MSEQPEQFITEADILDTPDWAWKLASAIVLRNQGCGNAAVLIQRAFAEREADLVAENAKLREACSELLSAQDAIDNCRDSKEATKPLVRRQFAFRAISIALAQQDTAALKSREADRG